MSWQLSTLSWNWSSNHSEHHCKHKWTCTQKNIVSHTQHWSIILKIQHNPSMFSSYSEKWKTCMHFWSEIMFSRWIKVMLNVKAHTLGFVVHVHKGIQTLASHAFLRYMLHFSSIHFRCLLHAIATLWSEMRPGPVVLLKYKMLKVIVWVRETGQLYKILSCLAQLGPSV